jgi:hypothetical protein
MKTDPENYPRYVRLGKNGPALKGGRSSYYRDAGEWSITPTFKNGRLEVGEKQISEMAHAIGMELIPCSEEEWKESNLGYV